MGLPSTPFAYDTETDREDPQDPETTYCCLVQICPIDATSPDDAMIFESEDAVGDFLDAWEDTPHDCEMHCYNLGNYEFEWLRGALIRNRYTNVPMDLNKKKIPKHCWRVMYDTAGVFKMEITNSDGYRLLIKDSMKIFHPALSMAAAADSIRKLHPEWWASVKDVKTKVRYNDGWHFYGHNRDEFIFYSKLDAFSQAMIMRYLIQEGMDAKISAAGHGMAEALQLMYGKEEWMAKRDFMAAYPPLDDLKQAIAEENLIGGQVWGEVGTHFGHFIKLDFKSSYPYEYAYGELFKGRVYSVMPDDEFFGRIASSGAFVRWYRLSFDFQLRDGYMPCINAKECGRTRFINLKMRTGRIDNRLYCESLLKEIAERYVITNTQIHEMWYARKKTGAFEGIIEYNFIKKETSKGALKVKAKLNLNGGIHGKTITKTSRQKRVFREDGEDGEVIWMDEHTQQQYNFMIGFTALENARARLLKYCRIMEEHGHKIYMCDTDSMIVDCPEDEVRRIIGDWMISPGQKAMKDILGRFEVEATFHCFKCWGLKRYCELEGYIPGKSGMFLGLTIGSAFAGMHNELQCQLLPFWRTDGTMYSWKQLSKRRLKRAHGTVLEPAEKHAGARDVWWTDDCEEMDRAISRLRHLDQRTLEQYAEEYYKDIYNLMKEKTGDEDMEAYLENVRYDKMDPYWRRHVQRAYDEAMKMNAAMYDREE